MCGRERKKSIPQSSTIDVVWISTPNHKPRHSAPTNYENRLIYTPRWFLGWFSHTWHNRAHMSESTSPALVACLLSSPNLLFLVTITAAPSRPSPHRASPTRTPNPNLLRPPPPPPLLEHCARPLAASRLIECLRIFVPRVAQDGDEGVRCRRYPRRSWAGPSTGRDEKAPLGGLSAATSRPPSTPPSCALRQPRAAWSPNCRCRHLTGVQELRWRRARHLRGRAPPCAGEELEEARAKVGDRDGGSDEFYGGVAVATRGNLVSGGGDLLTCAGCSHGGFPSRACCPLFCVRWSAVVGVKLRRPPADSIQRMRNPRMQRPERDEVVGAQRRQPPLPLVHAPDVGATQPLLTDNDRARRRELVPPPMRHTACRIAELRHGLCTPPHVVDLDRLPIEPRGLPAPNQGWTRHCGGGRIWHSDVASHGALSSLPVPLSSAQMSSDAAGTGAVRGKNWWHEFRHVGPILPRMRKPPQIPLRDVNQTIFIVRGCWIPGFVVGCWKPDNACRWRLWNGLFPPGNLALYTLPPSLIQCKMGIFYILL
jgi:hypothetical protein